MPVPSDPYDFANGTIADADQVDGRFAPLYHALDPAVVGLDRSNVKGGLLKLLEGVLADRSVAIGQDATAATVTDANTLSATISHGLAGTPIFAVASIRPGGLYGGVLHFSGVGARDGTHVQFDFGGQGFIGGNVIHFDWLAIG